MSSLAIPSSATAALSSASIHPHGHGHKKGLQADSATDPSSTPGQAASTPNLFSTLFDSLAQVLGAQPSQATRAAKVTAAAQPAQSGQAAQLSIGSKVNATA